MLRARTAKKDFTALLLTECLAKTYRNAHGVTAAGRTVLDHALITGAVAALLLERLPKCTLPFYPEGVDRIVSAHDVGKVCPTFQHKIHQAAGSLGTFPELADADPSLEQDWRGHASISFAALKAVQGNVFIPQIVGRHHGVPPKESYTASCNAYGGDAWQKRREELLALIMGERGWPDVSSKTQALLLMGLTTVADWIGSGELFDEPQKDWAPLVRKAVDHAGFLPLSLQTGLSFEALFGFSPREVQQAFIDQVSGPGVYILEAPMGMGKTEAALYAAYRMLEQGKAGGIYFALPTQLTSNKIHDRVNAFLSRILLQDSLQAPLLLHGKAWLKTFSEQEMGEDAAPGKPWFQSGKRGLLAPFAVGTIDQALMAVIRVRHSAVRAFGLAGKVVIIDEIHSYDTYTGTIIDELVALLRELNCTVIILSATLTQPRRAAFLGTHQPARTDYPLITAIDSQSDRFIEVPGADENVLKLDRTVTLHSDKTQDEALEEALLRSEGGQQILWIENTVAEAQAIYKGLAARASGMDVEVGLLHSRFTPADRERNESLWTSLYGAKSEARGEKGRILVGTQVLEQSLDIDADFLVTRICPTDMLFQRMGRLWRHDEGPSQMRRPAGACREAWILTPDLEEALQNPMKAFGKTGYIYSPYVLCRTLEQWAQRRSVRLPDDIRPVLEATYADRDETGSPLALALRKLEEDKRALRNHAYDSTAQWGNTVSEETVTTRAMQRPEADVLLLRSRGMNGGQCLLADGSEVTFPARSPEWRERARIASRLMANIVRVPENWLENVHRPSADLLNRLSPYLYVAPKDGGRPSLYIAALRADGTLEDGFGNDFGGSYTPEWGYEQTTSC